MHIFVGSTNPVKINAVINAASETWPDVLVLGLDVPSGIPEQPVGDEETRLGSVNRAKSALEDGLTQLKKEGKPIAKTEVLGVGLEGGVVEYEGDLWSTVWVSVADAQGNITEANGARFRVPAIIAEKIQSGEEMGPIVAQVAGIPDVKKTNGMIGVITNSFVDRTEEYSGIAKMALGLWYGRNWQEALS